MKTAFAALAIAFSALIHSFATTVDITGVELRRGRFFWPWGRGRPFFGAGDAGRTG